MMYHSPFFLKDPVGNNAFAWKERADHKLYVPSVMDGSWQDAIPGDQVVFEEIDEHRVLHSCTGLKNFIRAPHPVTGKPMVIVDNHNHVFYFWHEAREQGLIENGATLVHIDAHKDTRVPPSMLSAEDSRDLEKVFHYTNFVLNVGNYIPPAMKDGLVGELISITSEAELKKHNPQKYPSLIVNIDLDFWAPEMSYVDREYSLKRVREWMAHADLITFATSPFFIEQERALERLKDLC